MYLLKPLDPADVINIDLAARTYWATLDGEETSR